MSTDHAPYDSYPEATRATAEYFRQVAENWDEISAGYFGGAVRDAAIAKAYLRPEMVAADIGAGTGFVAAGLAPLVKRVAVVDSSAEMLAVAKKNLAEYPNVTFHEADGLGLPFPDRSLDAVFANMYLHHAVDPLAALREMTRVLRPGGRLVITDMDAHEYAWLKDEMADVWQGFERKQVYAWLREAGLVNVIVDSTGQSCCAESSAPALTDPQGREAKVSVFVATGTRRMTMREAVRDNYAAVAAAGKCGCSPSPVEEASTAPETVTLKKPTTLEDGCCGGGASGGGDSCCGGSAKSETLDESLLWAGTYSASELSTAPEEAAAFTLGCGNPIAMASLKPGEVVLDIGSGGGLDSFLAAAKVAPQGHVIGVDMTPAMLERARATAERNGIQNVTFRQGFAEALPVEDETVNVVLSNCVINLSEDKGQVFNEAFRVLKAGGRLEVSDVVTSGGLPLRLQEDSEGWAECVTGALPETEYLDLIRQAGFENITVRRRSKSGETSGVSIYSAIVSAQKPSPFVSKSGKLGLGKPAHPPGA